MPSEEIIKRPPEIFFEAFKKEMNVEDHIEFYCNRITEDRETSLRVETYDSEKIARVVLEKYSVKSRMKGSVVMVFPKHDSDIPIFCCQIGGRGDRVIALLDIAPTTKDIDYTPLIPVFEKYRDALGLGEIKAQWLTRTSSPYLLARHYDELDCELFVEAMEAYLQIWIDHYYTPGKTLEDPHQIDTVTNALYRFKYVLHHNDPAYEYFARSWGKGVADAFVHLECSDHPAYLPPEQLKSRVKPWFNPELNVEWTENAQLLAMEVPEGELDDVRNAMEERARTNDFGIITPEIFTRFSETAPS
ncbi:MAG: hypothetical protein ACN4GT_02965 [Gammaproteobacteria bacterium]